MNLRKKSDSVGQNAGSMPKKGKISPKAHQDIHKKNVYDATNEATNATKIYEESEELLRQKTKGERLSGQFIVSKFIVKFYPFFSLFTATIAGILIGGYVIDFKTDLFSLFTASMILLGILAMAFLFEGAKMYGGTENFENGQNWAIMLFLFGSIGSIVLSGAGGFLGTYYLNDNSNAIAQDFTAQSDSVRNLYLSQVADLDLQIESAKEVLGKKGNKWLKHSAREDLENAQNQKSELLAKIETSTEKLEGKQEKILTKDNTKNIQSATISGCFIFFFELVYLIAFWRKYAIAKVAKVENQNHEFVQVQEKISVPSSTPKIDLNDVAVQYFLSKTGLNQVQTGLNSSIQNSGLNSENEQVQTGIGFKPSSNGSNTAYTNMQKYLDKHSDIVECLNEGFKESETLEITGKSRSTFYNVKRVLNNLNSANISTK